MRTRPRHRWLAAAGFRLALPLAERVFAQFNTFRPTSQFAAERVRAVREQLENGETVYIAGINPGGTHNTGVALVEVSRENGPRIICNNEEERFSGKKHTTEFPYQAIDSLLGTMKRIGIGSQRIAAWIATWDYTAAAALAIRHMLEEAPASLTLLRSHTAVDIRADRARLASKRL